MLTSSPFSPACVMPGISRHAHPDGEPCIIHVSVLYIVFPIRQCAAWSSTKPYNTLPWNWPDIRVTNTWPNFWRSRRIFHIFFLCSRKKISEIHFSNMIRRSELRNIWEKTNSKIFREVRFITSLAPPILITPKKIPGLVQPLLPASSAQQA